MDLEEDTELNVLEYVGTDDGCEVCGTVCLDQDDVDVEEIAKTTMEEQNMEKADFWLNTYCIIDGKLCHRTKKHIKL